jgi:hypothetical protein
MKKEKGGESPWEEDPLTPPEGSMETPAVNPEPEQADQVPPASAEDIEPGEEKLPREDPPENPGAGQTDPPPKDPPEGPAIEEHAARLNIPAPIFAAVIQAEKWAGGKRVAESEFKAAVDRFTNGAADGAAGKDPPEEKK